MLSWWKTHHFTLLNSLRYCKLVSKKTCANQLLPRNFGCFFRDRRCVLPGVALVRVELLLNSRLPELTRVCRELRIARFTNSPRRDVADSFQYPKTALCHDSSLPHPHKLRHYHNPRGDGRPRLSSFVGKPNIFPVQTSLRRFPPLCQSSIIMLRKFLLMFVMLCLSWRECAAAPKPHVIGFGKWIFAKWPNATGQKLLDLKVRPLFVDTRLKEYTTGTPHELTDRLFVVRRAFRVNDALPTENANAMRWQWQRGGWLLVDRLTGHVSQLNLPEFDPFYSTASWYRDYIAYCGVSEDGKKLYAIVAQVGRRKPILKKDAGVPAGADDPDSECPPPVWERTPMRVTFQPDDDQKLVFSIRGRVVDVVNDTEETEE